MIADSRSRTATVLLGFFLGYGAIIANLLRIQVKNAHYFSKLGSQQYREKVVQSPPRAPLIDRTGKNYLAMNKDCISAFITPHKLISPETVYPFLKEQFPEGYERLLTHAQKKFLYIARRLTPEEIKSIEQNAIPDIQLICETSRFYPYPSAGPLIGLTDIDNQGIMGAEHAFNSTLAGTPTTYILERDARSGRFYFKRETTISGTSSTPVQLSIDADLQYLMMGELQKTFNQFQAQGAAAVIMDPDTGEILAMASLPEFDPNNLRTLHIEATKNSPLSDAYELGSVMKVFAALAALEEGVVGIDEPIDCKNAKTATFNGRTINTVHAHGILPFSDVIAHSNNIGIAIVASRLGDDLYTHYTRLGFGKKTGIELHGEHAGYVNPPEKWSKQSLISLSYGYEVSATLLQLASAFSIIANGGYQVTPTIMYDKNKQELLKQNITQKSSTKLYKESTITAIKDILEKTVISGTMRAAQIKGYRLMCKTGTANMLENGIYNPEKNLYTCAGIIEKGPYRRVIVVSIREAVGKNLYAATVAAPLLGHIAQKLVIHERII